MIIIAGETSARKDFASVSIMRNAACFRHKDSHVFDGDEKSKSTARILQWSGVPANEIMYSRLSESQLQSVDKGIGAKFLVREYISMTVVPLT